MIIREYRDADAEQMINAWNEVVEEGVAFPQEEYLTADTGKEFFTSQTYCGVAEEGGIVKGFYILHPNNVGRCGHIANASYVVSNRYRGQHIGEKLVADSLDQGARHGFKLMQFNAVVASNVHARHLYARLGFIQLGIIPKGFRLKSGSYDDIYIFYKEL